MDICGYLGKKWALYSGTPEIWFWSISQQGVTEEQGAAPKFLATSVARDTFCFLHSPLSTWIGVGHFEGLCPHEKTKDKGMDEGASSYLGTCNLLLQSLVDFGPKRQHWLTLKVSDCGQVVSWHWHNPAWPPNTGKLNRWYRLSAPLYFWYFELVSYHFICNVMTFNLVWCTRANCIQGQFRTNVSAKGHHTSNQAFTLPEGRGPIWRQPDRPLWRFYSAKFLTRSLWYENYHWILENTQFFQAWESEETSLNQSLGLIQTKICILRLHSSNSVLSFNFGPVLPFL